MQRERLVILPFIINGHCRKCYTVFYVHIVKLTWRYIIQMFLSCIMNTLQFWFAIWKQAGDNKKDWNLCIVVSLFRS